MKECQFSYTNNGKELVVLAIEPWLLIFEVPPLSTIVFDYNCSETNMAVIGFKNNSFNIYFDFEEMNVFLDGKDITSMYPINKK